MGTGGTCVRIVSSGGRRMKCLEERLLFYADFAVFVLRRWFLMRRRWGLRRRGSSAASWCPASTLCERAKDNDSGGQST